MTWERFGLVIIIFVAGLYVWVGPSKSETRAVIGADGQVTWSYRPSGGHFVIRNGDKIGTRTITRPLPGGGTETVTERLYEPTKCPRGMKVLRYGSWGC